MFKLHFQGKDSVLDKCDTYLGSLGKINTFEYAGQKGELVICQNKMTKCPTLLYDVASSEEKNKSYLIKVVQVLKTQGV